MQKNDFPSEILIGEPLIDIQAAVSILKYNGLLLILTPNGGEAGRDWKSTKRWKGFCVDFEHLQYLSLGTVSWLSSRLNMSIERLNAFGFPALKSNRSLSIRQDKTSRQTINSMRRTFFLTPVIKTSKFIKTRLFIEFQYPSFGSYHLFAVFRKR
ncbi:hypothetical protein ACFL0H_08845 [Thermodesulfobacteriota bacterium]